MTRARVPAPGGMALRFKATFRSARLKYRAGGVVEAATSPCSYCGGSAMVRGVMPIFMLRDDGAAAALCDDCANDALEVVRE